MADREPVYANEESPDVPNNHSDNGETFKRRPFYAPIYWIPCETILGLLTVFAIYVFICIVRYAIVKKPSPGRDMSGKQGKRLYLMCIVASGITVLRFLSDHAVAFLGPRNDESCFITVAVSTVFYALSVLAVYVFLWMRQSIFYANPVLSKILNKGVTFMSWSTLIIMCVSCLSLTVLYNLPQVTGWEYKVTKDGCMEISDTAEVVPAITVAITIYFQLSLLALFLYPLLSRKTQRYRSAGKANAEKTTNVNSSSHHPSSISNTDDNLTDGDGTVSHSVHSPRSHLKSNIEKTKIQPLEFESAAEAQGRSTSMQLPESLGETDTKETDKLKRLSSSLPSNGLPITPNANENAKQTLFKNKRPSIFSTSRIFKAGSLFYKRNQSKLGTVPQSPTAKRTRAKTVTSVSSKMESEDYSKERKLSGGSSRSETKRKLRRRAKRTKQGQRMMTYLKKSFYLMMVCVISDIMAVIVQGVAEVPELVYLVVFDFSLMINVICIVLSFRDWDLMLFPLCASNASRRNSSFVDSTKCSVKPDALHSQRRVDGSRIGTANGSGYKHPPELSSPNGVQYYKSRLSRNGKGSVSNGYALDGSNSNGHSKSLASLPANSNEIVNLNGNT